MWHILPEPGAGGDGGGMPVGSGRGGGTKFGLPSGPSAGPTGAVISRAASNSCGVPHLNPFTTFSLPPLSPHLCSAKKLHTTAQSSGHACNSTAQQRRAVHTMDLIC